MGARETVRLYHPLQTKPSGTPLVERNAQRVEMSIALAPIQTKGPLRLLPKRPNFRSQISGRSSFQRGAA